MIQTAHTFRRRLKPLIPAGKAGTIARAAGMNKSHLSRIVNGLQQPSIAAMEKLARAVGKPLHELIKP